MKEVSIPLSQVKEGQYAWVQRLAQTDSMRRRLMDLGVIPGTCMKCLRIAPAGSPAIYEIRGAMIALRQRDASGIWVLV